MAIKTKACSTSLRLCRLPLTFALSFQLKIFINFIGIVSLRIFRQSFLAISKRIFEFIISFSMLD